MTVHAAQVGKVLWGTIARILDFGAFVRPDGMDIDCLLHVSSISRSHVNDPRVSLASCLQAITTGAYLSMFG